VKGDFWGGCLFQRTLIAEYLEQMGDYEASKTLNLSKALDRISKIVGDA
jgi:hypothetical protein